MKNIKIFFGLLFAVCMSLFVYFVLTSKNALVAHPKGVIAHKELRLIIINVLLMLAIIVPTFIWLFITAYKYREENTRAEYAPEEAPGVFGQFFQWAVPSVIVLIMAVITWIATHELDPFQPIKSKVKPLSIQVVAMDWKWLFIYPEQQIATLNFVQIPEKTPINFALSADGSPMNSFWVPELSGQIYSMAGMVTPLPVMADGVGLYRGRAAEINGDGYSDMVFNVKSTSQQEFDEWVNAVKQSPIKLSDEVYQQLLKRTKNDPVTYYSTVKNDLFHEIVMKNMHHG